MPVHIGGGHHGLYVLPPFILPFCAWGRRVWSARAVRPLVPQPQGLRAKNVEIEMAVEDLIATLKQHPIDSSLPPVSEDECNKVRMQYNSLMYSVRAWTAVVPRVPSYVPALL